MGFKKGSIRKVTVHNFVTYTYVELCPGPNLNMLIGPNGTGKSTMVAAIILGLGGSPKTVGRGNKISEYVKHNCEEASVSLNLEVDENEQLTVTREFNLQDKSIWKINGVAVPFKEIEILKKKFNIQVDNLCQFLPQDRLVDFAKMNKQELLLQTQKALCKYDLIENHENLIKKREKQINLSSNIEKFDQKLKDLNDANIRLEGKMKNLKKRKKYLMQIESINRRIAWIEYDCLREKRDEIKADQNKAMKILEHHKKKCEPLQMSVKKANEIISGYQGKLSQYVNQVKEAKFSINKKLDHFNILKNDLNGTLEDMDNRSQLLKNNEEEKQRTYEQLEKLKQEKDKFVKVHPNDLTAINIQSINSEIKNISSQINILYEQKREKEYSRMQIHSQITLQKNIKNSLENVKEQQMKWLYRVDRDAHNAVNWLRSNKQLFKGNIYEPMVLELNVRNVSDAIYVENFIPMRDKVAFTCTDKSDMNLLIKTIREQQKWKINVIYSGDDGITADSYKPIIPINRLHSFGLNRYLKDLITGPNPIIKYLCKNYNLHNVPVGSELTNRKYETVPQQITKFFSDKFIFNTSFSKYTGTKSIRQSEIRSDNSLSNPVDRERLRAVENLLSNYATSAEKFSREEQSIQNQINELKNKKNDYNNEISNLQDNIEKLEYIERKIRMAQFKIKELQSAPHKEKEIKTDTKVKIKENIRKMVAQQKEVQNAFKNYTEILVKTQLEQLNLNSSQKQFVYIKNKLHDFKESFTHLESSLKVIKESYAQVTSDAKKALNKAKKLSNGFVPTDPGFEEFRNAYENFSDDVEELDSEKETILLKIDCLTTASDSEIRDFEERTGKILTVEKSLHVAKDELNQVTVEIDELQEKWLSPLRQLVEEINDKFSCAFKEMGCEGEVDVCTGNNEKNFAEYGLSIKVKYRHTEILQELNNLVQSGGERAVATAIFMLSLQELTPVPFRCVDEINQGMDPHNEKRIFDLLVNTTSKDDTSQYFIITPKLVPGLKFGPAIKIHFVHNGPFVASQEKWNFVN